MLNICYTSGHGLAVGFRKNELLKDISRVKKINKDRSQLDVTKIHFSSFIDFFQIVENHILRQGET